MTSVPPRPLRRGWPAWIALALLALAVGWWLAPQLRGRQGAEQVLRVGNQRGSTKAVMVAAGVLNGAPYRIEWSEFPAAQHLLEALGAGAIDIGLVGDAPFLFAYQSGSPIRAVGAQTTPNRPPEALAIIVPAGSPVHRIEDLAGKRIATTRGSVGHYLVLRALEQAGLPADAVKVTFLAPGDAKAAFSSGAIDAWAIWAPYLTSALKEHARILVDAHGLYDVYGFEAANDRAIAAKHALIADFLQREARALKWAQAHLDDYGVVLARETGLPPDIAHITAEKNLRVAVPIDDQIVDAQHVVQDHFAKAGMLPGNRPLAEGYDRSFASDKLATGR